MDGQTMAKDRGQHPKHIGQRPKMTQYTMTKMVCTEVDHQNVSMIGSSVNWQQELSPLILYISTTVTIHQKKLTIHRITQ